MRQYYIINQAGNTIGPMPPNELIQHGLTPDTPVWYDGLSEWTVAREVPELLAILGYAGQRQTPPTPPPPPMQGYQAPRFTVDQDPGEKPSTYMAWAIVTTLLCCLPFGIVSIVYSSKVDSLWYAGRYDEARNAANKAKNWAIAAAVAAIVYVIAVFAFGWSAFLFAL